MNAGRLNSEIAGNGRGRASMRRSVGGGECGANRIEAEREGPSAPAGGGRAQIEGGGRAHRRGARPTFTQHPAKRVTRRGAAAASLAGGALLGIGPRIVFVSPRRWKGAIEKAGELDRAAFNSCLQHRIIAGSERRRSHRRGTRPALSQHPVKRRTRRGAAAAFLAGGALVGIAPRIVFVSPGR